MKLHFTSKPVLSFYEKSQKGHVNKYFVGSARVTQRAPSAGLSRTDHMPTNGFRRHLFSSTETQARQGRASTFKFDEQGLLDQKQLFLSSFVPALEHLRPQRLA